MAFLMHICFANSCRLTKRVYYFTYRGINFKLIQNNPRQWADALLSLVPSRDEAAQQKAYATAGEFLSALSWQNGAQIALEYNGGFGRSSKFTLRQAKCGVFVFPQVSYGYGTTGYGLSPIPNIESEEQRKALALMREARSSNKVWLSFLFYWQIMEINGGDPVRCVNKKYYKAKVVHIETHELEGLGLQGKKLGEYLQDRCRDAIAHIRRHPGKVPLRFDDWKENRRMAISTRIAERFAKHYVRTELRLTKDLHLLRLGRRGLPVYTDPATL
jgi:methylamine utilization protein MauJ